MIRWIGKAAETLPARGYEQAYGVWPGKDFVLILDKEFGLTEVTLESYMVLAVI